MRATVSPGSPWRDENLGLQISVAAEPTALLIEYDRGRSAVETIQLVEMKGQVWEIVLLGTRVRRTEALLKAGFSYAVDRSAWVASECPPGWLDGKHRDWVGDESLGWGEDEAFKANVLKRTGWEIDLEV